MAQLPRISETLVKTISGKATHLKVVEILCNAYYGENGRNVMDVYAIEVPDVISMLFAE